MLCTKCGSEIDEGSLFCTNCGARIAEEKAAPSPLICPKCGRKMESGSLFCTNCGTRLSDEKDASGARETVPQIQSVPTNPHTSQETPNGQPHAGSVSFGRAIQLFFQNYSNFRGRASRSEFWWAWVFCFLINLGVMLLKVIPVVGTILGVVAMLLFLIPNLSIQVRRLHDTGKSWLYLLMYLIPLVGPIILLVFFCTASKGDNRWGPGPDSSEASNTAYAAAPATPAAPAAPAAPSGVEPMEDEKTVQEPAAPKPAEPEPETPKKVPALAVSYDCGGEIHRIEIKEYPCLIGRDSSTVQIALTDPKVSRTHAQFLKDGNRVLIEDLNSFNGTTVNGAKITEPTEVLPGDEIIAGTTRLVLEVNI